MNNAILQRILADATAAKKEALEAPAPAIAAPPADPTQAIAQLQDQQVRTEAAHNIKNLFLMTLGAGAAGRGALGLASLFKPAKPKPRSGPVTLPLPYPAEMKTAATSPMGLNWYAPGMLAAGLGGVGLGWAGVDKMLGAQKEQEKEDRLNSAKQQFHDALLAQYSNPLSSVKRAAAPTVMQELGEVLDRLWTKLAAVKSSGAIADAWNAAPGLYGAYALGSGLTGGALAYEMANKRSRRSILEKALKRRQQAEYAKSPPPLWATPEPVLSLPTMPASRELEESISEV